MPCLVFTVLTKRPCPRVSLMDKDNLGFEKIELKNDIKKPTPAVSSSAIDARTSRKFRPGKKFAGLGMGALIVIVLIVGFLGFVGFKAATMYKDSQKIYTQAKAAADAVKKQNAVLARDELVKTREQIQSFQKETQSLAFLKLIPLLGGYYGDIQHVLDASIHGTNAAIITAESIIPYADVLGLKGNKSFVMGSAEDRIRLAVKTMGKVVPKIDDIDKELTLAKADMDQVDVSKYPNFWIFGKMKAKIQEIKDIADQGVAAVTEGKPLIKVLPELLGEPASKKYMVLFQNDNELRPTGGFLTFYAIFRVDQGVIHIDNSSDIYKLDDSIPYHPTAPAIILKYLPKVPTLNIRDINLSPDFAVSMKDFRNMYEKSSMKTNIDGIIAIDTKFLVHIISILGEVQAGGQTFTAKTDPACNCPQVVYQLELNTTKPVGYIRKNRKAIVGDLLYATMQKALSSSPKLYWGKLFQSALSDAAEKHILFALDNPDAQKGMEALNWAGRIKDYQGDYLHINDANFGGAKSNMYISQDVKMEYRVASDGTISKTVTISYRNPQPYSDCNLERGGLCLNAILRDFQRLYVPQGSTLDSVKGSEVKVETKKDLGKTYFESFFTVNPLGKASIIYNYKLPFKLKPGSALPLLIQKQPGTGTIPFEIDMNGRKIKSFDLTQDTELTLTP